MRPVAADGGMKLVMAWTPGTRAAVPVLAFLSILLAASACMLGCGGGGVNSAALPPPPPPPPASITLTITPRTASVVLPNTQTFNPTVTHATATTATTDPNAVARRNADAA